MTLTFTTEQLPTFGSALDGWGSGVKTGASTTLGANRLQLLLAFSWSDVTAYPPYQVVTDSFSTFDFEEIVAARMQLESTIFAYKNGATDPNVPRYCTATLWRGFTPSAVTGQTTVDFGTYGASGFTASGGSGWHHIEIAGFVVPPTDNGASVMPQDVFDSGSDNNVVFGGVPAGRSELPDPLYNSESLTISTSLTEHGRNNNAAYIADGTKDLLGASSAFPGAGFILLRNSTDIYTTAVDDVSAFGSDTESAWTQYAFEVIEEPLEEVLGGYWGILAMPPA